MPPVTLHRRRTTVEDLPDVCILCGEPSVARRSYDLRSDPSFSEKLQIRFPLCKTHNKPYGQLAVNIPLTGLVLVVLGLIGFGISIALEKTRAPRPADGEGFDPAMEQPVVPKWANGILMGMILVGIALVFIQNFIPGFPVVAASWTPDSVTIGPVDTRFIAALERTRAGQGSPQDAGPPGQDDPFDFG